MARNHWLVKQEPEAYSWAQFVREKGTAWTGIRNFQARNNLRAMGPDDWIVFYESGDAKQAVGLAKVSRAAYADPTAEEGDWSAVDLVPVQALARPVPLQALKGDKLLKEMPWLRQSRLSVAPLTASEFKRLLALAETKI